MIYFADELDKYYLQSLNLLLIMSAFIFIKINNDVTYYFYKVTAYSIIIQLLIYPFILMFYGHFWENQGLIGLMGNPNVFGIYMLIAVLYFMIIDKNYIIATTISILSFLTGSLVTSIIGGLLLTICLLKIGKIKMFLLFIIIFSIFNYLEILPYMHSLGKLEALVNAIQNGDISGTTSIEGRVDYLIGGVDMMISDPISIIMGHPNGIAMYNGDGLYISFLVTFGFIVTLYFILCNIYLIVANIKNKSALNRMSIYVLLLFMIYFAFNRILDYWPCAIPYFFAYRYLIANLNFKSESIK